MLDIEKAKKTKVYQLANKNQFVIEYQLNDTLVSCFQSYTSLIAIYDRYTEKLYINADMWDYSKTTLKHLKMFINEWTIWDYDNKSQFEKMIRHESEMIVLFNER